MIAQSIKPLSTRLSLEACGAGLNVERVMGIEPTLFAWEAKVLPLNYTRMQAIVAIQWGAGAISV